MARRRPHLAGSAAVIVMTADLAAANARYVLTVPQAVFETKPEVLRIIEEAERAHPSPGPYRIHRMPIWDRWVGTRRASKDRIYEMIAWEHDTIQPKYGINWESSTPTRWASPSSTTTIGTSTVFPGKFTTPQVAKALGVELEKEVVYFPRRAYDMWNTRYLISP